MTKSPAASTTVVTLSGPQGLVAAVPQYLGFVPAESLVLMCLHAPRGRVGPVARVDLCPPEANDALDQLVAAAVRYADAVAVICYHQGRRPAALDALLDGLDEAGVPVTAVLSVRDGMIRDASSLGSMSLDPGVPVPSAEDEQMRTLAAASAISGRRVLPSREALRESIAGPSGPQLAAARAAIVHVCEEVARALHDSRGAQIRRTLTDRAADALSRAVHEHHDAGSVSVTTAAEVIVLSADVTTRDRIIAWAVGAQEPDLVPVLISVATRCPDEEAAEICAVLAVTAYRYGDGALAQCAVDRTLAVQSDHRLAHLMLSIMAAGLPPAELAMMATIGAGDEGADPRDRSGQRAGRGSRRPGAGPVRTGRAREPRRR
jgi:hypothetical protein